MILLRNTTSNQRKMPLVPPLKELPEDAIKGNLVYASRQRATFLRRSLREQIPKEILEELSSKIYKEISNKVSKEIPTV